MLRRLGFSLLQGRLCSSVVCTSCFSAHIFERRGSKHRKMRTFSRMHSLNQLFFSRCVGQGHNFLSIKKCSHMYNACYRRLKCVFQIRVKVRTRFQWWPRPMSKTGTTRSRFPGHQFASTKCFQNLLHHPKINFAPSPSPHVIVQKPHVTISDISSILIVYAEASFLLPTQLE